MVKSAEIWGPCKNERLFVCRIIIQNLTVLVSLVCVEQGLKNVCVA